MLIDLRNKNITGKAAQESLDAIGITCNKNSVPFDDKSPMITSGIRLGSPALTTRGMKEKEMEIIAGMINDVITSPDSDDVKKDTRKKIDDITAEFPLYPELFTW